MNSVRYIGMDVHRDTISVAVVDEQGRLMMESAKKPHGTTQRSMGSCSEERNTANTLQQRVVQPHTGAGCQGTSSSPAKGKVFPLDIPFYRTHCFSSASQIKSLDDPPGSLR